MAVVASRVNTSGSVMAAAVAIATVVLIMAAGVVAARPMLNLPDSTCNTTDKYVYPDGSFCWQPAELSEGYVYETAIWQGALGPEYDESNSTYYVRLTEDGARYVAVQADADNGTLLVNSPVYILNAESKRALKWRQEGLDEYFLIEEEVSSITDAAQFIFLQANNVPVPCILILPPVQCQSYYLVSYPSSTTSTSGAFFTGSGLLAYVEEGVTYVKAAALGSKGDLPLLLRRSFSTSSAILPFPTIRKVTDHGA